MFLKTFSLFNAFEPIHKFLQLCLLHVVNVHISKGKEGVLLVKGSLENVLSTPTSTLVKVGARPLSIEEVLIAILFSFMKFTRFRY